MDGSCHLLYTCLSGWHLLYTCLSGCHLLYTSLSGWHLLYIWLLGWHLLYTWLSGWHLLCKWLSTWYLLNAHDCQADIYYICIHMIVKLMTRTAYAWLSKWYLLYTHDYLANTYYICIHDYQLNTCCLRLIVKHTHTAFLEMVVILPRYDAGSIHCSHSTEETKLMTPRELT